MYAQKFTPSLYPSEHRPAMSPSSIHLYVTVDASCDAFVMTAAAGNTQILRMLFGSTVTLISTSNNWMEWGSSIRPSVVLPVFHLCFYDESARSRRRSRHSLQVSRSFVWASNDVALAADMSRPNEGNSSIHGHGYVFGDPVRHFLSFIFVFTNWLVLTNRILRLTKN